MMSHTNATTNDRIVLLTTLLAGLALVGAATGTLGAAFFGSLPWEAILGGIADIIGGGDVGSVISDLIGKIF
jgi:F0F1-type ATP synthase assembly protein I